MTSQEHQLGRHLAERSRSMHQSLLCLNTPRRLSAGGLHDIFFNACSISCGTFQQTNPLVYGVPKKTLASAEGLAMSAVLCLLPEPVAGASDRQWRFSTLHTTWLPFKKIKKPSQARVRRPTRWFILTAQLCNKSATMALYVFALYQLRIFLSGFLTLPWPVTRWTCYHSPAQTACAPERFVLFCFIASAQF